MQSFPSSYVLVCGYQNRLLRIVFGVDGNALLNVEQLAAPKSTTPAEKTAGFGNKRRTNSARHYGCGADTEMK